MIGHRWLAALVALSIAPTAVGGAARADDRPESWLVGKVRFEPLQPEGSRTDVTGLGAYRGTMEFDARGGLAVYNELRLEDYVKGIVEMPAAWPAAALQAQAIAARTYALNIQSGRGEICPDDGCQFYMGLFGEEREGGERWAAAVDATAGKVLLGNGQPIRSEFSASNGGRSLPGGSPYLRPVDDPDDSYSPMHRWRYNVPLSDYAPLVSVPEGSTLVRLAREGDSVVSVAKPKEGDPVESRMGVAEFASAANASLHAPGGLPLPFPSMSFTLSTEGDQAVVDGGGWGHGRGMSQWGAYGKALRGYSAADIVAAYYGLRPSAVPESLSGTAIRVALGTRGSAAVNLSRPTRLVSGDGTVLVPLTQGRWSVSAERGGVRVRPPAGSSEGVQVTDVVLAPGMLRAGYRPTVRFSVSGPAVVTVRLRGPDIAEDTPPVLMMEGGQQTVPLPPTRTPGQHVVTIEADGGPGRSASVEVKFAITPYTVLQASAAPHAVPRTPWLVIACLLAAVALSGVAAVARRAC